MTSAEQQFHSDPVGFGQALLAAGDLDPVYECLHRASLPDNQLRRWLLAYWCLYHTGAASYVSEYGGCHFWQKMMLAAQNTAPSPIGGRWPRGRERRYFRGEASVRAVDQLAADWPNPEHLVNYLCLTEPGQGVLPYQELRRKVVELPLFGPWIAFKVGDMLERVLAVPVDFFQADVMMFEQPRLAALILYHQLTGEDVNKADQEAAVKKSAGYLLKAFRNHPAPPRGERPCNIQEIETILCKWKSHRNGHYPVGNDVREVRHALSEWSPVSQTAALLLSRAPEEA